MLLEKPVSAIIMHPKPHLKYFLQGKYPTPQLGQEVKDQVRAHKCHRLPRIPSQFPRMQQWMMK